MTAAVLVFQQPTGQRMGGNSSKCVLAVAWQYEAPLHYNTGYLEMSLCVQ